jgi:hypothetical protein
MAFVIIVMIAGVLLAIGGAAIILAIRDYLN